MDWAPLVPVSPVTGDVPMDPNAEFWTKRPGANVPLVGQVIADPGTSIPPSTWSLYGRCTLSGRRSSI